MIQVTVYDVNDWGSGFGRNKSFFFGHMNSPFKQLDSKLAEGTVHGKS